MPELPRAPGDRHVGPFDGAQGRLQRALGGRGGPFGVYWRGGRPDRDPRLRRLRPFGCAQGRRGGGESFDCTQDRPDRRRGQPNRKRGGGGDGTQQRPLGVHGDGGGEHRHDGAHRRDGHRPARRPGCSRGRESGLVYTQQGDPAGGVAWPPAERQVEEVEA